MAALRTRVSHHKKVSTPIHELAQQLAAIAGWNDFRRGVTVNAGIIEGGHTHECYPGTRTRAP